MFFLVSGISIQNAFMWSQMDIEHVHQHTFAYIALFLGAGMLVIWEFYYSMILIAITLLSNGICYLMFSSLSLSEFLIHGGFLTFSVVLFAVFMIRSRYRMTLNEIRSRLILALSKEIIESEHALTVAQKQEIEGKNEEILSSIRYAKRIQTALQPSEIFMKHVFPDCFVFYKPKDIVSGDFYWMDKLEVIDASGNNSSVICCAVADCTGHGVPGAFMSLIGNNFLKQSVRDKKIYTPAEVLDYLNKNLIQSLNQNLESDPIRDGMDIVFITIDFQKMELQFAGANNPIYVIRDKELMIVKPDKQAIGSVSEVQIPFTNHQIALRSGDLIYLFTDGYADQFGGTNGKKLKYKSMQSLFLSISDLELSEQLSNIRIHFENWKGNLEQTDDVCVLGIRIP